MRRFSQQGISLYFAVIIMSVLLFMVLGLGAILVNQQKIIRGMENSVIAFYAADTGIERILYAIRKEGYDPAVDCSSFPCSPSCPDCSSKTLSNQASYSVTIDAPGGTCQAANYCVKSIGSYQETKRAVEINF